MSNIFLKNKMQKTGLENICLKYDGNLINAGFFEFSSLTPPLPPSHHSPHSSPLPFLLPPSPQISPHIVRAVSCYVSMKGDLGERGGEGGARWRWGEGGHF